MLSSVIAMPVSSTMPMLAVPRWPETARLAKDEPVVSPLNRTPSAVLVCSGPLMPLRQLTTN